MQDDDQQEAPGKQSRQRRRGLPIRTIVGRFVVWPLCLISIAIHVTFGHADYSILARVQAGLLSSLALLSLAWAPVRVMPAIAIGIGYFYFALGTPVFSRNVVVTVSGPLKVSSRALESATLAALVYAVVAVLSALVADRAVRRAAWYVTRRIDGTGPMTDYYVYVARFIAAASLALRAAMVLGVHFGSIHQPVGLFASPIISLTLLFCNADGTKDSFDRYLYWGAIGLCFGLGMMTGMLGDALTPGVVAGSLMWATRARLPIGLIALGLGLLLFLNPAKSTYRNLAWYGRERHNTVLDRVLLWGVAIERTYGANSSDSDLNRSVASTTGRMNTLGQVGQIFDWVPKRVPYAGADRWIALPSLAVPRVFWPDKPGVDGFYNRNYTHVFKMQNRKTVGSITLPAVGDGYWRLGWLGVFIEASLLGGLLGTAQGVSRGGTRSALLLAASLFQLRTDSHVFGSITGTLQQAAIALVVAWVASKLASLLVDSPLEQRIATSQSGLLRPSVENDSLAP